MSPSAALAQVHEPPMQLHSDLLGSLAVEPSQVFRFPAGLFGFPAARDFVLLPAEQEGLYWLQSMEHTALAFVLVDPFVFFDGYEVEIPDSDLRDIGAPERPDLLILAVVTLPRTPDASPTANLQGPIAINLRERMAKQIPLADSQYDVRSPFQLSSAES